MYLHRETTGICTSETINDEFIVSCVDNDVDIESQAMLLTYNYYKRVKIIIDNVHSYSTVLKSISKELSKDEITLTVTNTRLTDINDVLVITNVSELHLSDCFLTKIKFDDLLILNEATKLNFSHNYISTLKSPMSGTVHPLLTTIDLSYNLINKVPDNCFSSFNDLKHLNLSHNSISHFSATVFEGISQLESLYLSNNKLSSIANNLKGLKNIKILHLDYNYISNISDLNALIYLEELKLGHNEIEVINENTFSTLTNLAKLDLSHNNINVISTQLKNNYLLQELRLTDNNIIFFDKTAFHGKKFKNLVLNGNNLVILFKSRLFDGLDCDNLDLSNSGIHIIKQDVFSGTTLRSLNLSMTQLFSIEVSAFSDVKDLQELDLSRNSLTSLVFLNPGIEGLKKLFLQKNVFNKIANNSFTNFPSLEVLDLSYNIIQFVDSDAFISLKKLEKLSLNNNGLFSIHLLNFRGLSAAINFDLSYTGIGNFTEAAIPGLKSTVFNCSRAELTYIHFNAFAEVERIDILDLSYNALVAFEVNPKALSKVELLYLNNNKITSISNTTFVGFSELRDLYLQFNDIVNIVPQAFSSLISLKILNLSYNRDLQVSGDVFNNLRSLMLLTMTNNKNSLEFQNTVNTSIAQVDLSSCDIADLESLHIYNVKGIVSLNISHNLIEHIDSKSFKTMPKLFFLDVSFNLIKSIEPGSFVNTQNIVNLNLNNNQLSDFQHGVFQGLTYLKTFSVSNNLIREFNIDLLHSSEALQEISLENNLITEIKLKHFVAFNNMGTVFIGGNNISCHYFTDFKKFLREGYYTLKTVSSETPNYHTDNVDGVDCRPENKTGTNDANHNTNSIYSGQLTDSVARIYKAIDNSNQEYYLKSIFNILIVTLAASVVFLLVKYIPIRRYMMPLNRNLFNYQRYNNNSQTIVNDNQEISAI